MKIFPLLLCLLLCCVASAKSHQTKALSISVQVVGDWGIVWIGVHAEKRWRLERSADLIKWETVAEGRKGGYHVAIPMETQGFFRLAEGGKAHKKPHPDVPPGPPSNRPP